MTEFEKHCQYPFLEDKTNTGFSKFSIKHSGKFMKPMVLQVEDPYQKKLVRKIKALTLK